MEPQSAHCISLDADQQDVFVKYFNKLPEKPRSTIRFFFRSDYYTVHGEDAEFTAEQTCIPSHLKTMGSDENHLSYIVISKNAFTDYIRELLLVKQYRVDVYVNKNNKQNEWEVEYRGSPGNINQFEDLLYERNDPIITNILMSVYPIRDNALGIVCINSTDNIFNVGEINDNEFFTELDGLLAQICPNECLVPEGNNPTLENLKKVIGRAGICTTTVKRNQYSSENIIQDLNRLLHFNEDQQRNARSIPETAKTDALKALAAAVNFQNLLSDESNFNQFRLQALDSTQYVRVDNFVLKALNIYPEELHKIGNKATSVYGLLNCCVTGQGRRLLWQWLKCPLRDINLINERLDVVETLAENSELRQILFGNLSRFPDLLKLIKRLGGKKSTLEDCYKLYQAVTYLPSLHSILKKLSNKSIQSALTEPLGELILDMEKYTEMIEQTLDLDRVDDGEYLIKSSFNSDLVEIAEEKESIMKRMRKQLEYAQEDLQLDGEKIKLEANSQFGYVMRVSLKDDNLLRKRGNYIVLQAIKAGVRFTTKKLEDLNDKYKATIENYERTQNSLVSELLNVASGYCDVLRNVNAIVAKLDVLISLSMAATSAPIPFVRPRMLQSGSGVFKLKQVRHPCLELLDNSPYIPNDVTFNEQNIFYIITGPNMGGKSTYIRSVGIAALMAHVGSFVPCEEAEISILDCIHARVGADDSQLKGMSTFMVEMVETASIIRTSTKNSLIIIDELGRGTSTYDGCGLAAAIAKYIAAEIQCFCLYATHYYELTVLAGEEEKMGNLYVTAIEHPDGITPLYQVKEGICDRSFGIHCAKMAGFPDDVLKHAQTILKELEHSLGVKALASVEPEKKRVIVKEADSIIDKTLTDFFGMDIDNLTEQEFMEKISKMKSEALSKDNLYIKTLSSV